MTTASWATPVDHSTTAGYRTWGAEWSSKLSAVGMVQTADTGQINWGTITLPSPNSTNGYEIWRLSSSNLYFKFTYGTGNAIAAPEIQIQVGTGSNGSGTLTGQLSTATTSGRTGGGIGITSGTNFQSYMCATANYFFVAWKIGGFASVTNSGAVFFSVGQTVDSTGAATSVGYYVLAGGAGSGTWQAVATSAGVTGGQAAWASANFTVMFGANTATPSSSQDGSGNNQAFLWWYSVLGTTQTLPLLHGALILSADLTLGATTTLTLVGSTGHTYIAASNLWSQVNASGAPGTTALKFACLFE